MEGLLWGSAAAFGYVAGFWLYEMYGRRVRAWLVSVLELPKKL